MNRDTMQETILAIITNEEFTERVSDTKNYRKVSVRGVIFDDKKNVAIIYSSKENYYKLPGGWVEEGESDEVALQRECREEAGVDIIMETLLWTIIEQDKAGEIIQENRWYIATVTWKQWAPNLTDEEQKRKFELHRMDIDEAISLMKENSPISYRWRFMQARDVQFLQTAKQIITS
jgi:8-oxo-dGTP diphosphatase